MAENKTPEQIKKENFLREQMGEEPISESVESKTDTDLGKEKNGIENEKKETIEGEKDEVKTDEKEKVSDEEPIIKIVSKKKEPEVKKEEEKVDEGSNEDEDDIDEAKLLKALSKKAGKEIKSVEEFLSPKKEDTEEDIEALKEKREADKISYGLSKGLVTKKQYEGFISDIKNPVELVFKQYLEEQLSEDADLDESDVRSEFDYKFGLDRDEDSREYKRGMKEINLLSESIIKATYPEVFKLESEYSKIENEQKQANEHKKVVLSKAPQYKSDVEDVFKNTKSIRVKFSETEEHEVHIDDSILSTYKNDMLNEQYAESKISKGWTKEEIQTNLNAAIILDNFNEIVKAVTDSVLLKREKGLKGVMPNKNFTPRKALTPEEQKKVDFLNKQLEAQSSVTNN
jgi:hypothetical protein